MSISAQRRIPWTERPFEELKAEILARVGHHSPFMNAAPADVRQALDRLPSISHEDWARAWSSVAEPYEQRANQMEASGRTADARAAYLKAWTYFSIARHPCPSSAPKQAAYARSRAAYLSAARHFDHVFERVVLPFPAQPGEGSELVFYLHRPRDVVRPPVVVTCAGIDQFKEEGHATAVRYVAQGLAAAVYDMPGTGEAPVIGSPTAERLYDVLLPHLAGRADVDGSRMAIVGRSFGGYWSTKAAHTHARWFKAAVNWGGSAHYAFQPAFIRESSSATSYLFELLETRAHAFGLTTADEYIAAAPRLSLLTSGVLDQPCAPMLLVNGRDDQQVPIQDLYLLLEHGDPKLARVFPGGHLGPVPVVDELVRAWVVQQLRQPS